MVRGEGQHQRKHHEAKATKTSSAKSDPSEDHDGIPQKYVTPTANSQEEEEEDERSSEEKEEEMEHKDSSEEEQEETEDKQEKKAQDNNKQRPDAEPSPQKKRLLTKRQASSKGNSLTHLIPGYTAPMRLDTSNTLGQYKVGLAELCKQAHQEEEQSSRFAPLDYSKSFKHGDKKKKKKKEQSQSAGAGAGWFHMQSTPMTEELKMDLAILRNRNYMNPNKFYKSNDVKRDGPLQVGTVVEGPSEFFSSRLTKKERKSHLTDEFLATSSDYAKRKFREWTAAGNQKQPNRKKLKGGGKLLYNKKARRGYY
mmetsp:Transcript_21643/g.49957  ORF Transcript_21643/g.49957 Transcript_21643/m.49957 type:complete len:310 (+) Transcript_21643:122-1051(+)|eukprot:CAMPEP_0116858738 /NCGR_PEP_ID=MMETSP0418-20121206/21362_1 /TAXON_ID=1158023 /ORGANISM="Astrosyne radiata, Strain 13vi08-1A" /LENGTH=309 /DNA_ID=CAMNT_0004492739 /DNA_START=109 /DNA_END=1038 /DNA_ORIENTATION=-